MPTLLQLRKVSGALKKLQSYEISKIYNAEESGPSYDVLMDPTAATREFFRRTRKKRGFESLSCSIVGASNKTELMSISRTAKWRTIEQQSAFDLGSDYQSIEKARTTSRLRSGWLHRLDRHIAKNPGSKAALLASSCSVHLRAVTTSSLETEVKLLLPSKKTSRPKPVEAEVTASMDMRYENAHAKLAVDPLDDEEENIHAADILSALHAVKGI